MNYKFKTTVTDAVNVLFQVGLGQLFFQGGRGVEVNHEVSGSCQSLRKSKIS